MAAEVEDMGKELLHPRPGGEGRSQRLQCRRLQPGQQDGSIALPHLMSQDMPLLVQIQWNRRLARIFWVKDGSGQEGQHPEHTGWVALFILCLLGRLKHHILCLNDDAL